MTFTKSILTCIAVLFITTAAYTQEKDLSKLTGPYLGQKPPGVVPEIFAPQILTSEKFPHGHLNISKDGKTLYWATMKNRENTILYSRFDGKTLTKPERAEFAAEKGTGGPSISYDGKRIYFSADSTANPKGNKRTVICYTEWEKKKWGKPVVIESTSDTLMTKGQVSVAKSGNIYFSGRVYSEDAPSIYVCKKKGDKILPPERVKGDILKESAILDPWIDPEERFLLCSFPGGSNPPMLFDIGISFRQKDGTWGKPVRFGGDVNTTAFERFPSLSPDGRFLFFIRSTSPGFVGDKAHFYWVDAKIIEEYRTKK